MKKLNKKGFTLIEMLVVIAIIAVLVAIIIPVISSSTTKAAAATNAANLRSVKAEATTEFLSGAINNDGYVKVEVDNNGTITLTLQNTPKAKAVGTGDNAVTENTPMVMSYNTTSKEIAIAYGDYTIDDFAKTAETGNLGEGSYESIADGEKTQYP